MIRHTITEDELSDYIERQRVEWMRFAASHGTSKDGTKSDKRLEFQFGAVAPLYRVKHFGTDVYIGALKETAVREYNALP